VATPKQRIRMPDARWKAVLHRAHSRGTDASKVGNALFAAYERGLVDDVVDALLPELAAEARTVRSAARRGDGQP
jgi:hypothetical protein